MSSRRTGSDGATEVPAADELVASIDAGPAAGDRSPLGRAPRKPLIRYRIDIISVAVVVGLFALQMAAWGFAWPWYACIPIIILMRWSHLVQHNHAHLSIFGRESLDEPLGWLMFFGDGLPLEFYRIQHVQTHHKFNNREGDWTSPFAFRGTRFPDKPISKFFYVLTYPAISYCGSLVEVLHRPGSRSLRRFMLSFVVVGGGCVALAVIDFRSFALFFLAPWVVGWFGAASNNWDHHVDCEYTDDATSANMNMGILCRGLGFNIGYHSAHHLRAGLHWSQLPAFHERVMAAQVPARYYRRGRPKQPSEPVAV